MKCSKCGKKILTRLAFLNGKVICQECWERSRSRGGNIMSYWNKYIGI